MVEYRLPRFQEQFLLDAYTSIRQSLPSHPYSTPGYKIPKPSHLGNYDESNE